MAWPAKRHASYEDLLAVPQHLVAEILDGDLITQPRPSALHALAASAVMIDLSSRFHPGKGGPGGWFIPFQPELHLRGNVLIPDVAGWRRERMPSVPQARAFELAPDWVCEVVSPATAA